MAYSKPVYIALTNVLRRHGPAIVQLLDDDHDGVADSDVVQELVENASSHADSFLYANFGPGTVQKLEDDARFIDAVCDIFAGMAGERRQEFERQDGSYPHAGKLKRGVETLKLLGQGVQRFGAEAEHGRNTAAIGSTSVALPHTHIFAPSIARPKGGGGF